MEQVMSYFNLDLQEDRSAPAVADLQHLLFGRMQTETIQLIRRESNLLFPVIRNTSARNKALKPAAYDSVQQSFQKIQLLLQKVRQVSGNYQLQEQWSAEYKLCTGDLFITEQLLQQWIYVAQNILYPAVIPGHTAIISQDDIDNVIID
ncbi:hypothetical protein [Chitinophaga hostae]|uniref:Uncharacterized protein n=1 Tax=Chitinophaga hostae TaxID=2831022 RepID=A0ABS5ISK4_9BACT|nr:hypothetical protein [Chitinophaga hostae]MBS0025934.1 hypothetical protein [Chitinophaga hostae]